MPLINPFVSETAFPAILEARTWLESYDGSKGLPLDLSQAAPPYAPPEGLLEQLGLAAEAATTARYGPVPGEEALRVTYAEQVSRLYNASIKPAEVSITSGANQAFMISAMLVAQRSEAVILPVPWYFNHQMTLNMLGVEARPFSCGPNFLPDPSQLDALIDDKVRALVLVTPNNPTGAVYSPELISKLATICRKRDIWLIVDETYRDFLPEAMAQPHDLFSDSTRDGVIGLYSFSKSLAIPGHRLGAMICPPNIALDVIKVQDCVQICPPRAAQIAVTWGLQHLAGWRSDMRSFFRDRIDAFQSAMRSAPEWKIDSIGGYFAYLRHPFDGMPAVEVAKKLARQNGLLLLPGSFFGPGQERHLRISIGNLSREALGTLPDRLRL